MKLPWQSTFGWKMDFIHRIVGALYGYSEFRLISIGSRAPWNTSHGGESSSLNENDFPCNTSSSSSRQNGFGPRLNPAEPGAPWFDSLCKFRYRWMISFVCSIEKLGRLFDVAILREENMLFFQNKYTSLCTFSVHAGIFRFY